MEKVVSFVFKMLGFSIIAMIVLDMALMLTDAFITNSRVQAQASLMQSEIAKNNYLSAEAIDMFRGDELNDTGFEHICNLSRVYTSIEFNSDELSSPKNYGEYQNLKITAQLDPWIYVYSGRGRELQKKSTREGGISVVYNYMIPCLRYLK